MDHVAQGFEALGAVILVAGVLWSMVLAVLAWRRSGPAGPAATRRCAQAFGGTLLLGLEVLVAADLIRTVAVAPTLDNVLVLGLDRADQDIPQLLPGDRDRGRRAVAARAASGAGTDQRAPPPHASLDRRPSER